MKRIGLISDTHAMGKRLPPAVLDAFSGVDMILHAGDLVSQEVLDALAEIAPVVAVHGNMDHPETRLALPEKTIVSAEDKRIGLIHGDRVPNPNRVLPPPIDYAALHAYLFSEFATDPPDCIVYGHTHAAHVARYQDVLMVNPGSATRGSGGRNTVGLLIVRDGHLTAEIIPL